jgi:D-lyxose ketol-isomerase
VWPGHPEKTTGQPFEMIVNNRPQQFKGGDIVVLESGHRVTLVPGVWHEFAPVSDECIIGEVSTANDDANDNFFANPDVGRYPHVDEDEPAIVKLLSDPS